MMSRAKLRCPFGMIVTEMMPWFAKEGVHLIINSKEKKRNTGWNHRRSCSEYRKEANMCV